MTKRAPIAASLVLFVAGCASQSRPSSTPIPAHERAALEASAEARFRAGVALLALGDREGTWPAARCTEAIAHFQRAAEGLPSSRSKAQFNEALVRQRCGDEGAAMQVHRGILAIEPSFFLARVELGRGLARAGSLDAAIAELRRAVVDARFKSPDALATLAFVQMRRDGSASDAEGSSDRERARKNLERALAVDDGYMPAYNLLALNHLASAKPKGEGAAARRGQLELGALVCSQAIRKNARYAPIHNTLGLTEVALGNLAAGIRAFNEARRLDPRLFDAHMNAAALNLDFRGFREAEAAYRAALAVRPNDYDARLGLALALRGRLDEPGSTQKTSEIAAELAKAKTLAPNRPEAYYNEAVFTEVFLARTGEAAVAGANLAKARVLLGEFLARARGLAPEAQKRATDRLADIDAAMQFNR